MKSSVRPLTFFAIIALVLASLPAAAKEDDAGFITSSSAMLVGVGAGVQVKPLVTVGDVLPGGVKFEGLPDGIAIDPRGRDQLNIYVNHETSTVPFLNVVDPINSLLVSLTLKRGAGKVVDSTVVIGSNSNFQRFCSNFFAGPAEGFDQPLVFTNEEATDFVNRTGQAWPGGPNAEQAGLVVAYDPDADEFRAIYGMGRHNHENSVAVPGYGQPVILSGDDTFSAPASQMYMYVAEDRDAVWNDEGDLYAFVSSNAAINDYGDLTTGASVTGTFLQVPDNIADGDQTGLENWSNTNNVFQFIRIEDIAYDRNTPNIVYFADTGEPRAIPDAATTRLRRGPSGTMGNYPNGRIFKMVLNENSPLLVDSLSILINADPAGPGVPGVLHQPDNIETTADSLMIQEDPGSHNQFPANNPNGTNARIWRYDLETGDLTVVAKTDQSLLPAASLGSWESSGIVDASDYFGAGAFLVDIQAHGLSIGPTQTVPNPVISSNNPLGSNTVRTEAGQLLLIRVPGA